MVTALKGRSDVVLVTYGCHLTCRVHRRPYLWNTILPICRKSDQSIALKLSTNCLNCLTERRNNSTHLRQGHCSKDDHEWRTPRSTWGPTSLTCWSSSSSGQSLDRIRWATSSRRRRWRKWSSNQANKRLLKGKLLQRSKTQNIYSSI